MSGREPAFVIGGGQRCGSTSLYHLMDAHPDIYMAKPIRPEPKFFLKDPTAGRDKSWYLETYFSDWSNELVAGEKSTSYLETTGVVHRIRDMFPEMKVIFILRNPIERAISNYRFSKKHGLETLSFDQAISQEDRRLKTQDYPDLSTNPFAYQRRGLYADMLKPFIQELPAGQLKIVSFDDLKARPESVLSELYEFVGVDSKFRPAGLHEKHNAHSQDNLRISHETLDRMLNFFLEPNQRLETILGQNLGAWNDASQLAEELLKH
ncbi:sulfotransferase family protein [Gimesia chilikensis]|uniref:sulfotransferase family protein n=1 Tax=Gimesia chilikensis TaxID=2605989 RepID=UPI001187B52C|nr:sulfotransferase [Gimesia chilikensis]MCR9231779.1 sulfotransferase [bacterium]QDT87620.1 Sulfotransferase domain protein [Gimesia chilikensis]